MMRSLLGVTTSRFVMHFWFDQYYYYYYYYQSVKSVNRIHQSGSWRRVGPDSLSCDSSIVPSVPWFFFFFLCLGGMSLLNQVM